MLSPVASPPSVMSPVAMPPAMVPPAMVPPAMAPPAMRIPIVMRPEPGDTQVQTVGFCMVPLTGMSAPVAPALVPSTAWRLCLEHAPRSVQLAVQALARAGRSVCEHCRMLENAAFDADGKLTALFCDSCLMRIATLPEYICGGGTPQCMRKKHLDGLAKPSRLCKNCHQWKTESAH